MVQWDIHILCMVNRKGLVRKQLLPISLYYTGISLKKLQKITQKLHNKDLRLWTGHLMNTHLRALPLNKLTWITSMMLTTCQQCCFTYCIFQIIRCTQVLERKTGEKLLNCTHEQHTFKDVLWTKCQYITMLLLIVEHKELLLESHSLLPIVSSSERTNCQCHYWYTFVKASTTVSFH
jgi:hypothetical protein